jgi:trypsin
MLMYTLLSFASLANAIIGGREITPPFRLTWLVSLSCASSGEHCCAGILLGPGWVLTAAHCASHCPLPMLRVQQHRHDLGKRPDQEGGIQRTVAERIEHPGWSKGSLVHDVALLRLGSQVYETVKGQEDAKYFYSQFMHRNSPSRHPQLKNLNSPSARITNYPSNGQPATTLYPTLAQPSSPVTAHSMATVAGWGATQEWGGNSGVLLQVEIPILSQDRCLAVYGASLFREGMLCAGGLPLKDACTGDSGGPLFVEQGSSVLLIGLVSWGFRCGAPRMPGIYTSVAEHVDWIRAHTSSN